MGLNNRIGNIGRSGVIASFVLGALILFSFEVREAGTTEPFTLEYPAYFGSRFTIPADNPMTKEGVYLGRLLFYEPKLSAGNKISCATCHQQQRAFTDGKQFSTGADGTLTRRNSMSLTNLLWVRNLFWDGRVTDLEAQAVVPLTDPHEMGQPLEVSASKLQTVSMYPPLFKKAFGSVNITSDRILKALAQFERTLISADSRYDRYLRNEYQPTVEELNGLTLFMTSPSPEKNIRGANCTHCHGMPKTFSELFHNNGLDSIPKDDGRKDLTRLDIDRGRFRVPTLRNIALTSPYMHDGRFNTLQQVVDHYSDHVRQSETLSPFIAEVSNEKDGKQLSLTEKEKYDLISFLNMLTDPAFVQNPAFSDPHRQRSNQP